jgi:uncharacterized coiled-coil protein SlyX
MDNTRLTELEIRVEYQEQTIGVLNEVIIALRSQVDTLQDELNKLRTRFEEGEHSFGPANEKPPHY